MTLEHAQLLLNFARAWEKCAVFEVLDQGRLLGVMEPDLFDPDDADDAEGLANWRALEQAHWDLIDAGILPPIKLYNGGVAKRPA